MGKTIGIDLGTTNSVAAIYEDGEVFVLDAGGKGKFNVPSVVHYQQNKRDPQKSRILVGEPAVNFAELAPEQTVFSIKRLMGRSYNDPNVERARESFSFSVVAPEAGQDSGLRVALGQQQYTPVEISAMILKQIKEGAEWHLDAPVTHAVITVPAYFEERQKAATRQAGQEAGLIVKRIIDEPTAAAIAFGLEQPGAQHRTLVYDFGGGTFDISIIEMVDNHLRVTGMEGDNWLGGDDLDRVIVQQITAWIQQHHGVDPRQDPRYPLLAKKEAEKAKIVLSGNSVADLFLPAMVRTSGKTIDVEMTISRDQFEELIRAHVDRSLLLTRKAMEDQSLTPESFSAVLLVGGSSIVPLVRQSIIELFGEEKLRANLDPMQSVAMGAAILAARLQGLECPACGEVNPEERETCQRDGCGHSLAAGRDVLSVGGLGAILSQSFGIQTLRDGDPGAYAVILPKGTPLPTDQPASRTFYPPQDDTQVLRIPIYQGEHDQVKRNVLQAEICHDLPRAISSSTPVQVAIELTRDERLSVVVRIPEIGYDERRSVVRNPVDASYDEPEQAERAWQEELQGSIRVVEGFLEKYHDYLEPPHRRQIERNLDQARKALEQGDEIEARLLDKALQDCLYSSGLASRLFIAERAALVAPGAFAQNIDQAVRALKKAHRDQDGEAVLELDEMIRQLIAQALSQRSEGPEVEGVGTRHEILEDRG